MIGDMLELGKKAETYHREIGKMLNEENIQYVFTYGELAKFVAEEARKNYHIGKVQSFDNKAEIAEEVLKSNNEKGCRIIERFTWNKL